MSALVLFAAACSGGKPSSGDAGRPGQTGTSYLVTVSRQAGGTVSSGADGKINCGTAGSSCGPVAYPWGARVTLVATPDAGKMLGTWAGDCSGRTKNADGQYVCVLDTTQYGADKYVLAVFGEAGRTQHGNFNDPALHGAEFLRRVANQADTFDCAHCHGATYGGRGIALSCTECHALKAGVPNWLTACGFCHDAPPPTSSGHPAASGGLTGCAACHPGTVTTAGAIVEGGGHMNGTVEGSGHGDWTSPALHGPKFFDAVAGAAGTLVCSDCHDPDYAKLMNAQGDSCGSCHAGAGWTGWLTNCSFCHGDKNADSQRGGYDLLAHPMWSAPRTGGHEAHLATGATHGGRFTAPFACATCHAVPSGVTHIGGAEARATVALSAAGRAALPAELGDYDPVSRTCTTYCHGAAPSPSWTTTDPIACGSCHGLAPAPSTGHPAVSSALTGCVLCHDATMNANGTIDLASGTHLDGRVQASAIHGDYESPTVHGPKFFGFVAGGGGDCRTCHGANDDGGIGPSCNACHASAGWTTWQSNCSFCHGDKNTESQRGGYDLALQPMWSAPDVGAHEAHLTGTTAGGLSFAKPFACETCHAVPTNLSHIGGADAAATVVLAGAGQASLPVSLGSYDPASGSCATYCHGTAASPAWLATGLECGACHGVPPRPETGHPIVSAVLSECSACHPATVKADGTLDVAGGKHVNGVVEKVSFHTAAFRPPSAHSSEFFKSLAGTTTLDCKGCHGATYGGGTGPSCNGCHSSAGWAAWQTNCSFCHGARTAAAKAGYVFTANPAWSAPPETVSGAVDLTRSGAHQVHLSGMSGGVRYSAPFKCATCHIVPGDMAHAAGPERAQVALAPAGQGSLPQLLGTYSNGTCTTYCHGTTLTGKSVWPAGGSTTPTWGGPPIQCTNCHGQPPPTGTGTVACGGCHDNNLHSLHAWASEYRGEAYYDCGECHLSTIASATPTGEFPWYSYSYTLSDAHVNGAKNVQFRRGGSYDASGGCTAVCHGNTRIQWR